MLLRRERSGAGAAVVTGDQHHVGVRLGDAGRHGADTDLGDQLGVDSRLWVGVLEVVDQLLEILDRVDVVVGRRRDEANARGRVARCRNPRIDLGSWKLSTLARLRALRKLDLKVVRVHEVFARDTEST